MKLKDFATQRNVDKYTIQKYITRHPELFSKCVTHERNGYELDDKAIQILDEKYPLPKPVEVVVDHASRDELIKTQNELLAAKDFIIKLQQELNDSKLLLAKAESAQLLLVDKTKELESKEKEVKELSKELVENKSAKDRLASENFIYKSDNDKMNRELQNMQMQLMQKDDELRRKDDAIKEKDKELETEKGRYKKGLFGWKKLY